MKITQPQKIAKIPIFFNKNSLTLKNLHKKNIILERILSLIGYP